MEHEVSGFRNNCDFYSVFFLHRVLGEWSRIGSCHEINLVDLPSICDGVCGVQDSRWD
jgi:hypothetical protein